MADEAKARSSNVRHVMVNIGAVPRDQLKRSSNDMHLPDGESDYYSLCTNERIACAPGVMRGLILDAIGAHSPEIGRPLPCIRPVIVASIKPTFLDGVHRNRCRVALDLDTAADTSDALFPSAEQLRDTCTAWLEKWCEFEIGAGSPAPRCIVFIGSFGDKFCSAHVYFPDLVWQPNTRNVYKNNLRAISDLDDQLLAFGLKTDPSITTSGLKLPFMNKRLKEHGYRNQVQVLAGVFGFGEDTHLSYYEIYDLCDAVVPASHAESFCKTVKFKPQAGQAGTLKRVAPQRVRQQLVLPAAGPATPIDERLFAAVPEWGHGVEIRRIHKDEGVTICIPQSTHCPLKSEATADNPAYKHGDMGKSFAVVLGDGTIKIRCHICAGAEIVLEADNEDEEEVEELLLWFNKRYAKLATDKVLEYGSVLNDGSISSFRVLTQREMLAQLRHLPRMMMGKKKVTQVDLWLDCPRATRYPLGLLCDPRQTCDPRYFNTWRGFNPKVLALAESPEFAEMESDQLLELCKTFCDLVALNICAENQDSVDYVLKWLASMFQHPGEKCRTALVVTGPPGAGKGLFGQYILEIVGSPHGLQVDSKALTGEYNYGIADATFLFCDEAVADGNEQSRSAVKSLITESTFVVRRKYRDDIVGQRNFAHLLVTSNDRNSVYWQKGERRFVAMAADYRLAPDHSPEWSEFIASNVEEREQLRGPAALFCWLMRLDITDWNPQAIPATTASWATHYESLTTISKWVYRVLCTGDVIYHFEPEKSEDIAAVGALMDRNGYEHDDMGQRALEISAIGVDVFSRGEMIYPKMIMAAGFKHAYPDSGKNYESALWKYLYSLLPEAEWSAQRLNLSRGVRAQTFKFPTLAALRRAFMLVEGERDERIFTDWRVA